MAGLLEYTKNGQVTEPPLYRFMKGNVQSFLNSIPDPSKMTPEEQLALGANVNPIMGLLGATAYHGSPYLFDKFDPKKIGTGQGQQSYGYGTYFSENPKVADYYKYQLKPTEEYLQKVNKGEYNDLSNLVTQGTLYKVDIPDTSIPKMLDWDKPIKEQKSIMQALKKASKQKDEFANDILKYDLVDEPTLLGKDLYDKLNYQFGENQSLSSDYLSKFGLKGIKYLDEGSRGTGQGTSNFVVFDPSQVKILEKGLLGK